MTAGLGIGSRRRSPVTGTSLAPFPSKALASLCDLRRLRIEDGLPDYSVYVATSRAIAGIQITAAGIDPDPALARIKAVAETFERLCLSEPFGSTKYARRRDLPGPTLDPARWLPFKPAQYLEANFPYRPWSEDLEYRWIQGRDLESGTPIWIPAALVLLGAEDRLTAGVSTGAAAHRSHAAALCAGLYEVIERDALTIMWESRSTPPPVNASALWQDVETRDLDEALGRLGLWLHLRDITTDVAIPTVLAAIVDPAYRRPALAIGAAAGPDLRLACLKAAREAYLTWSWMLDEHRRRPIDLARARRLAASPVEMMWQAYLYGFPEAADEAGHLFAPTDSSQQALHHHVDVPSNIGDAATAAFLVKSLVAVGFRPIAVDLLNRQAEAFGFVAVKSIVPGLVPLSIGDQCRPLANARIAQVPARMGWMHSEPRPIGSGLPIPLP